MPKSFIERLSARFTDDKSAPMLRDDALEDSKSSGRVSEKENREMANLESAAPLRVIDASNVNVLVAQSRIQDTEYLQRKENAFFALFRQPSELQKPNPRILKAQWGELNPHFIAKLLVTKSLHLFFTVVLTHVRSNLRPSS
jgi:hypothetical protein